MPAAARPAPGCNGSRAAPGAEPDLARRRDEETSINTLKRRTEVLPNQQTRAVASERRPQMGVVPPR